jgi:hypothetical protein
MITDMLDLLEMDSAHLQGKLASATTVVVMDPLMCRIGMFGIYLSLT